MNYIDTEKLIYKIKAEIERRMKILREDEVVRQNCTSGFLEGKIYGYEEALSFLSTLESENPINQEGLEEEIKRTYHDGSVTDTSDLDHNSYENIARHFAKWGAEHAREQMMVELRSYCLSEIGRFPEGNDTSRATRETYYDIIGYLDKNYGCK